MLPTCGRHIFNTAPSPTVGASRRGIFQRIVTRLVAAPHVVFVGCIDLVIQVLGRPGEFKDVFLCISSILSTTAAATPAA